jgi:hypothetical protein
VKTRLFVFLTLAATLGTGSALAAELQCLLERAPGALSSLPEASGAAVSRRTPGIVWSHGDSATITPYLFAFNARGAARGKVRLEGIKVTDWEDIAVGPCGRSSCVYVADIGDNRATRDAISIHRFVEPSPRDPTAPVLDSFHATYPDGPHDAEAFFVTEAGEMFVVTKGETGSIALYGFGPSPRSGASTILKQVAVLRSDTVPRNLRITGASASPDGKWVALRTRDSIQIHDAARFSRGDLGSVRSYAVTSLREPQGEGVTLGPSGAVFLTGEGGGKGAPGTLAAGICRFR